MSKAKSPGKIKRRKVLSEMRNNIKKPQEETEDKPSTSNENIKLPVTPDLPKINVAEPSFQSTPKRPKIVKSNDKRNNLNIGEEETSTVERDSAGLLLKNENQAKQIDYLKKRIVEIERQRDQWKLKFFHKPKQCKCKSSKPLSAIDDMLFCTRFNISTKKRKQMKAFLREKKIHLFAKNEEVGKLELVKDIATNFEYKETTITVTAKKDKQKKTDDTVTKEKVIHSYVSRDPRPLIVTYLTYLDNYKKLNPINRRIRGGFSGDDGRGWTKICFIPLDVPLSSSRDNALVLAIFDAKDNYENLSLFCKALFELLNNIIFIEINGEVYELEIFAIGDMCFLCALFGHAGHSAKYPCLLCYITKGHLDEIGRRRTWEEMMTNFENNEFSQKHPPLLKCKVSNIVPSVLHIPLGIGSDGLKTLEDLEIKIGKRGSIKAILSKYNLSRHPQTKQLNGNDMRKFLTKSSIFVDLRKIFENTIVQEVADKIIDVCSTLGLIQGMMAIKSFDDRQLANLKNIIQRFKVLYIESPLNFTPKGHWLVLHGPEFVEQHRMWGKASEHGQEAIHGPTDDDMYKYRSLPIKKKIELVVRNCFLRNLVFAKSAA